MKGEFKLVMIGAMYENGGNTTHRFLDGHPDLYVYPFESQLGTHQVQDYMTSLWPVKYRWPVFDVEGNPRDDYKNIIDEECKVRSRVAHVSKFRHWKFNFSDDERRDRYVRLVQQMGRTRRNSVEAFFRATFESWKNRKSSGRESIYVGYSPVMTVDAEKIMADFPNAHVLHIVRNPWSAYADTKKRPVPQSLARYIHGWCLNQYFALIYRDMFPGHVHIVRIEDVMANPVKTLGAFLKSIGSGPAPSLRHVTWNSTRLKELYPWGTILTPTPASNKATAMELTPAERDEVRMRAKPYLKAFGYEGFIR